MVKLIKLNVSGDVDEVNVSLKKNEKYNLSLLKTELQISDKTFKLQHEWDLDNKKVLKLLGRVGKIILRFTKFLFDICRSILYT